MTTAQTNSLRFRQSLSLALGATVVLAATAARAEDWPTPGLDAAHARLSSERTGARFTDGRWTASVAGGARVLASPVVADGTVVSVDLEGAVRALRADDGQPVWQVSLGTAVQGTPGGGARAGVSFPTDRQHGGGVAARRRRPICGRATWAG
jgi:hypothetical protein